MFCANCGEQIIGEARFCPNCGTKTENGAGKENNTYQHDYSQQNAYRQNDYRPYQKTPTQTLADRERASAIVWTVIACLQGAIGIFTVSGLSLLGSIVGLPLGWSGIFILALAAYNGYCAYCSFQRVKSVLARRRGIVCEYDKMLTASIIFIVLNIIFGAVVGVAGAIFDLFNRSYALSNAQYLED